MFLRVFYKLCAERVEALVVRGERAAARFERVVDDLHLAPGVRERHRGDIPEGPAPTTNASTDRLCAVRTSLAFAGSFRGPRRVARTLA